MNFLRKHFRIISIISLTVVALVTALSVWELRKIRFDYDFESFFPVNDPDLDTYLQFRKTFEYDNEYVLLALEKKSGIFDQQFLADVQQLTDSLRVIPDITSVQSPTDMSYFTTSGSYPYIHISEPERYASDSVRIYQSKELVGSFFAPGGKSVSLFIKTTEGISKEKSDRVLARLNAEIARYKFDAVHLASKLNGQKVYLDRLQHEFIIFFIASFLLIVIFLYVSFRTFWGVWVPILIVILAIIWTLALMTATGKSLDIMTVLLPTMMFVVGMSDVVHIVTKYLEELRKGATNRFDTLLKTIKEVSFVTFITQVTTALGFLTLMNSHIAPIRDFGLYTSLGILIAFVLAFTIMPVVLNLIPRPDVGREAKTSFFWQRRLTRFLSWILRNGKKIGVATVALALLSGWGISRIHINNYLIEGLTRHDQLREDFIFFENNFSGVRPFEIIVTPSDSNSSVLGTKELRAIDKLENYLEKNYGVGFIISPATLVKAGNKTLNDGDNKYFRLPENDSALQEIAAEIAHQSVRKEIKLLIRVDEKKDSTTGKLISRTIGKEGRITGKMHDIGSEKIRAQNKALYAFMANDPAMKAIHIQLTGASVMLDKNNEYLVNNMLLGLLLSVIVVGVMMALIHRSWRMTVIAIIPNLIPILFMGGIMGFFGIDLKSSTSIIFCIAFGIATDDTIHFLGRLRLEMKNSKSVAFAIRRTFLSTGKAVIVTSLILSAGFMTLVGSGFESTYYFGLLVSITLVIAVLADLLLFPLLVSWFIRNENK